MKPILDYLWMPFFIGAYALGGIYPATIALMGATTAMVIGWWLWKREWNKTYLLVAAVTLVLGSVTLYLHDPAFIKLKPTIVYAGFALALGLSHFVGDKVLMARLPQQLIQLPDPVWRKVNAAWATYFAFCAALNWYVATHFEEKTWVTFKLVGFTGLMFVFLLAHAPFLAKYLPQDEGGAR